MIKFRPEDCLVLVVDDVSKNLELAVKILDFADCATICANGVKQAMERVKNANPDLTILDLMMQNLGYIKLC